jgi:hypothetical protein
VRAAAREQLHWGGHCAYFTETTAKTSSWKSKQQQATVGQNNYASRGLRENAA